MSVVSGALLSYALNSKGAETILLSWLRNSKRTWERTKPRSLAGVLQRAATARVDNRFNCDAEYSEELAKVVANLGGADVDWVERTFEV